MKNKPWQVPGSFVPRRLEMYSSPAWQAAPPRMNAFLEQLEIEHMRHRGSANGTLIKGYSQFVEAGFNRGTISKLIKTAEALGFIKVNRSSGFGPQDLRDANMYTLTYLPTGTRQEFPPTDDWKRIRTAEQARAIVDRETQKCAAKPKSDIEKAV